MTGQRIGRTRPAPPIALVVIGLMGAAALIGGATLGCWDHQGCKWLPGGGPVAVSPTSPRVTSQRDSMAPPPAPTAAGLTATPVPATPIVTLTPSPSSSPAAIALSGQIAYSFGVGHRAEIYVMRPDGSDPRRVTFNDYQDRAPSFSPDGQALVFSSSRENGWQLRVDFNLAYNPYCAYNPRWSCPVPPRENRLKVPIRAGEKAYSPEGEVGI